MLPSKTPTAILVESLCKVQMEGIASVKFALSADSSSEKPCHLQCHCSFNSYWGKRKPTKIRIKI